MEVIFCLIQNVDFISPVDEIISINDRFTSANSATIHVLGIKLRSTSTLPINVLSVHLQPTNIYWLELYYLVSLIFSTKCAEFLM